MSSTKYRIVGHVELFNQYSIMQKCLVWELHNMEIYLM